MRYTAMTAGKGVFAGIGILVQPAILTSGAQGGMGRSHAAGSVAR